jgi:alpha-ketoglutaric semialdehyde dehydrogenase|tara:strand:+ start:3798 stop:4091 length:294 start_codon:yes stop_codon:yes gene_type:complete
MLDKTNFVPHGRHLISGQWIKGEKTFNSAPASGPSHAFSVGSPALVDQSAKSAEEAFWSYGYTSRAKRAAFLNAIADNIEARAEAITEIGSQETGLP